MRFVDDVDNFKKYPLGTDIYEEISKELDLCRVSFIPKKDAKREDLGLGERGSPRAPYYIWKGAH